MLNWSHQDELEEEKPSVSVQRVCEEMECQVVDAKTIVEAMNTKNVSSEVFTFLWVRFFLFFLFFLF